MLSGTPTLTRSQSPSQSSSQTQTSTCAVLSPLDFTRLAADWGTTPEMVENASTTSTQLFGCAGNDKAFLRSVFILAKDIAELDARAGFDKAKLLLNPVPYHPPLGGQCPYLSFFLKDSSIIAVYFRDRVDRLLDDGDIETSGSFDFNTELLAYVEKHPEWKNTSSSYISLLANPMLHRSMISRVQLTGLCFLHAPLVALHYAINMRSPEPNNETVDITTALRHNFHDGILGSYLFADKGWWTSDIINKVFEPSPGFDDPEVLEFTIRDSMSADLSERDYNTLRVELVESGVGIITLFNIDIPFWKANATSFSGKALTQFIGGHAMVLIGARFDNPSGQYYLLFQNWWESLQIVEVRQDYAKANNAHLTFVKTPQNAYRKNWRTVSYKSAKSAAESAGVELPRQS